MKIEEYVKEIIQESKEIMASHRGDCEAYEYHAGRKEAMEVLLSKIKRGKFDDVRQRYTENPARH